MLRGAQFGPINSAVPRTAGYSGAQRVQGAHGKYFDVAYSQRGFFAANQVATAWSVALATTYTGLVISNPANSKTLLVMMQAHFALTVAPAGIASIGYITGYSQAGIVTHTTPLTPLSTYLDQDQANGVAKADAAATLVGTPRWCGQFMGGFTAGALPATSPSIQDLDGLYIVPPGGYFGIGALTAVTALAALFWEEIPILR